ncbi:MAG: inositol monophosphatase [Actinobacteria bacterium]|nr:inositol monophosphatase [Actinomycetota bacterium]
MPPQERTPSLGPDDRDVVAAAREALHPLLDELRPELLARSGNVELELKDDGTPVTSVDLEVNDRLLARLSEVFPEHTVVSEELVTGHEDSRWTWIVDPIDGTSNFISGLPYWCISMALTLDGHPVLGLVEAPPVAARYEAVAGEGATGNGEPLSVMPPVDWSDRRNRHVPLLLTTATARRARPAVRLNPRVMGSAALDLCQVAAGNAAASLSFAPKVWDVAAGVLLILEAGGEYLTLDGPPLLPLRADTEYAGRSAPAAAGPNADYLRALVDTLVTDPIAVPRAR